MIISQELSKRLITSLILIPLVIFIIYKGGILYALFLSLISGLMLIEWDNIVFKSDCENKKKKYYNLIGLIYITIFAFSAMIFRKLDNGFMNTIWVFSNIWVTDTVAYFVGKKIGGPKLAPSISPNKTISGAIGGLFGAFIITIIFAYNLENINIVNFIILGLVISIIGQIGDLVESAFKRKFKVKDSGNIIPGHGGVLDRLDSVLLVMPIILLILYFYSGLINVN